MSGAEIPLPDLVALLTAVQNDLKNPHNLEHPNFGRMRLVPMPAPLPSLWFGLLIPFDAVERAQSYEVVEKWLHRELRAAEVEDLFMPGCQVIDGAPIAAV